MKTQFLLRPFVLNAMLCVQILNGYSEDRISFISKQPNYNNIEFSEDYLNPELPIEQRIDDLLSKMTLEEKIGQLNMPCLYQSGFGNTLEEKTEGCRKFVEGNLIEGIGPGGGFFTLANNILLEGTEQQTLFFNELQKTALENTRLKIPLLQTEEGTHGLMCSGATVFPEGNGLGSTWDIELIKNVYKSAAEEARSVGIHQLYTLVIEPNRDPRLGRNQETYSEDPFLCSRIAESIVTAMQGNDISSKGSVIAGLCHFPGQSQPVCGLERGAMEISERMLREVFLPPWEAGVKNAGALGVMATYPTIDGIPVHSSKKILTDLLRDELEFEGLVLSEGNGVNTLVYTGVAPDIKSASAMAAEAGVDVSISFNQGYFNEMIENVLERNVSVETIDRSVRRILKIKLMLGLFENPFVDPQHAKKIVHSSEHQKLSLLAAREGIVLLKNEDNLLPLSKEISSIAIIGPNADDERNQLGDYTSKVILQEIFTVLDGIRNKVKKPEQVKYVKGCDVIGEETNEIEKAAEIAANSDIAIVVLGENEWQKANKMGTVGEGFDAATLELTGKQLELVQQVYATGTKTIVILINGRPLAIPWIDEHIPAILEAWNPGEKGGEAIADILFGDCNPGGKLTVTFPRHAGHLPVYYNHKPSKTYWLEEGWGNSYVDINSQPLYSFGHGLSYTSFAYANLMITPEKMVKNQKALISMDVTNTGKMEGQEVVQLYIRDKISTVVRPVMELKGFSKVTLQPGETKNVEFILGFEELKLLNREMEWDVEPGEFEIMIGSASDDIRLKGIMEVY